MTCRTGRIRRATATIALLTMAVSAAACGGDDDAGSPDTDTTLDTSETTSTASSGAPATTGDSESTTAEPGAESGPDLRTLASERQAAACPIFLERVAETLATEPGKQDIPAICEAGFGTPSTLIGLAISAGTDALVGDRCAALAAGEPPDDSFLNSSDELSSIDVSGRPALLALDTNGFTGRIVGCDDDGLFYNISINGQQGSDLSSLAATLLEIAYAA